MKTRAFVLISLILGGVAIAAELESKPSAGVAAERSLVAEEPTHLPPLSPKQTLVTISAATLGEDCGESPERAPAPKPSKVKASMEDSAAPASQHSSSVARGAAARRACEQTSMQLSVRAGADAAASGIKVKSVEVYDETGKLIGKLTHRGPSVWTAASGSYQTWDEKTVPGADLQVRYVLTAPDWSKVVNRWNHSYTIKAVITVGGTEQKLERAVHLQIETSLPPGVVT